MKMFDYLIEANNLQKDFSEYGLDETDITFIKELIIGPGVNRGPDKVCHNIPSNFVAKSFMSHVAHGWDERLSLSLDGTLVPCRLGPSRSWYSFTYLGRMKSRIILCRKEGHTNIRISAKRGSNWGPCGRKAVITNPSHDSAQQTLVLIYLPQKDEKLS